MFQAYFEAGDILLSVIAFEFLVKQRLFDDRLECAS